MKNRYSFVEGNVSIFVAVEECRKAFGKKSFFARMSVSRGERDRGREV